MRDRPPWRYYYPTRPPRPPAERKPAVVPMILEPPAPVVLIGSLPDLETDCACPTPPVSGSSAPLAAGPWSIVPELYTEPLSEGWALFCNAPGGGTPAVLNVQAAHRLGDFATPQPLTTPIDRELASARLIFPQWGQSPPLLSRPTPSPPGSTLRMPATSTAHTATSGSQPPEWISPRALEQSMLW